MTDQTIPFAPFVPLAPSQTPEAPPAGKSRKKKTTAATAPATAASAPAKPKRKASAKASKARAPKFELQTILAVASSLKEDDMPLFEKLLGQLQDAGKSTRERVLAAVSKVFA